MERARFSSVQRYGSLCSSLCVTASSSARSPKRASQGSSISSPSFLSSSYSPSPSIPSTSSASPVSSSPGSPTSSSCSSLSVSVLSAPTHLSLFPNSLLLLVACMPIKIHHQFENPDGELLSQSPRKGRDSILKYATMGLLLGLLIRIYDYSDRLHPKFVLFLYSLHLYFSLEIVLAMAAALTRTILGVELEPQFHEPYLSTSLQDFWGRRWNLMVTSILRPAVYEPVRRLSSRAVGRKWSTLPAVMATFAASAVMHELVFYYMGRMRPNWEMSGFFLLHGSCLVAEMAVKKVVGGRFRLPGVVSGALTVGFVMGSGIWQFFPQFIRVEADVRALEEYAAVGAFVRDMGISFIDFIQLNRTATI